MRQPDWIRMAIKAGLPFQRQKQNPLMHNARNLATFAVLLALIAGTIAACDHVSPLLYVPIAGFVLGVAFFSLIILVVHEASHQMFVISRRPERARRWNRAFGWAVSVPFAIDYARHWESGHILHHLHPLEARDTQTVVAPMTGAAFLSMVLKMLFVPGYVLYWNPSRKYGSSRWLMVAMAGFWSTCIGLAVATGRWPVALAALVGFQVLGALNQAKMSLEHGGAIADDPNPFLRSRTTLFAGRAVLMPLNISLHFEHHLNFNVPWYALPAYQKVLREVVPAPLQAEIFNRDPWRQLAGGLGGIPVEAVVPGVSAETSPSPSSTTCGLESPPSG